MKCSSIIACICLMFCLAAPGVNAERREGDGSGWNDLDAFTKKAVLTGYLVGYQHGLKSYSLIHNGLFEEWPSRTEVDRAISFAPVQTQTFYRVRDKVLAVLDRAFENDVYAPGDMPMLLNAALSCEYMAFGSTAEGCLAVFGPLIQKSPHRIFSPGARKNRLQGVPLIAETVADHRELWQLLDTQAKGSLLRMFLHGYSFGCASFPVIYEKMHGKRLSEEQARAAEAYCPLYNSSMGAVWPSLLTFINYAHRDGRYSHIDMYSLMDIGVLCEFHRKGVLPGDCLRVFDEFIQESFPR